MNLSEPTSDLLEVLQWPRVGPARLREFLAATRPGSSVMEAAHRLGPVPTREQMDAARSLRDEILGKCTVLGIHVVGLADQSYPAALRLISDPSPVLYVRGPLDVLSRPAIAVVGTREASESGKRNARTIARVLVRHGFVVVSGLALGIDTQAHLGALDEHGTTVAVLAHGLHTVAPTSNKALAESIIAAGGCLVSEHPPGVSARPPEFVRRNRIQSGLSLGSIVVESGLEGGSIHQANFTRLQGRRLMTVLAASDETRGSLQEEGALHLVATLGAIALRSTADLVQQLRNLPPLSSHGPTSGTLTLF